MNYVEGKNKEDGTLLLACNDTGRDQANAWYLDIGTNNHMSENRNKFMELNELVKGNVTFRYDSKVLVKRKGKILFHVKDGGHQLISNVYYMPNMKSNIVSLGQLLKNDYDIQLKDYNLFF